MERELNKLFNGTNYNKEYVIIREIWSIKLEFPNFFEEFSYQIVVLVWEEEPLGGGGEIVGLPVPLAVGDDHQQVEEAQVASNLPQEGVHAPLQVLAVQVFVDGSLGGGLVGGYGVSTLQ